MVAIPVSKALVFLGTAGVLTNGEALTAVKAGGQVLFGSQTSAADEAEVAWNKGCDNMKDAPFITSAKTGLAYWGLDTLRDIVTKNGKKHIKFGPLIFT